MSNVLEDFFNVKTDIKNEVAQVVEFRPSAKKGQAGIYKALVRFLPNPEDPNGKSIVQKNTVWLENPITKEAMEVDCPSSISQPSPLQQTFFALRNSTDPILKENSKKFSRRQRFASLVQIIDCPSEPQLVNKILVWRYGFKISQKIESEIHPMLEPEGGPRNPFDLFRGRVFSVVVTEKAGFNDFDQSQFVDSTPQQGGMRIFYNNAWIPVTAELCQNPEARQIVFEYLKNNAPSLEPFEYHEWTAQITDFVNNCIRIYSSRENTLAAQNPQAHIQTLSGSPAGQPVVQPQVQPQVQNVMPFNNPVMNSNPIPQAAPTPTPDLSGLGMSMGMSSIPNIQPQPQPQANPFQMGLDMNTISGNSDPRGFGSSPLPTSLNDVMSSSKPAATNTDNEVQSLDKILGDVMM